MRLVSLLLLAACAGEPVGGRIFRQAQIGPNGIVLTHFPDPKQEWIVQKDSPSAGRFRFSIKGFLNAPFCTYMSSDTNIYAIDIYNWSAPTSTDLDIQVLFNHVPIDTLYVDVLCTGEGV